ncbi:MAG: ribonuclease Z [Desulforegulaceae bacterium]|nr:ribonuclease Z [Desulforegulaceae bacterium]
MKITILGSGSCVFSLKRAASSILVETEKINLLVDAGTGCTRRLLEKGFKIETLDGIFLSHFHIDHSSELVPILFSLKYGNYSNLKEKFFLMGGPGLNDFYEKLKIVYGHWIDLDGKIEILEFEKINSPKIEFYDIDIETFHVNHRPESLALKILDKKNKIFVYSGDMDLTPGFEIFINNCDLLVIESAMPDNLKVEGHLTPVLAAGIGLKGNVKELILTHFYPQCEKDDFLINADKIFKGNIKLAKDLMEIKL